MSGSPGTWRTWPGSWTPVYPGIRAVWPPKITVLHPARPEGRRIWPGSFVGGFITCVLSPLKIYALGTSSGLRNMVSFVIRNLICLKDYYNFCLMYQNLAVSLFLLSLSCHYLSLLLWHVFTVLQFFCPGTIGADVKSAYYKGRLLEGIVWGEWVPMAKILFEHQPLCDVSGLLLGYILNRVSHNGNSELSVHVNTVGCLPSSTASTDHGRITEQMLGQQNEILLPAPTSWNPGDFINWTWQWNLWHMEQWLALLATCWHGLQAGLTTIPVLIPGWPEKFT